VEIVKRQAQRQILLYKRKDLAAMKPVMEQPESNSQEEGGEHPVDPEVLDTIRRTRLTVRILMIIGIVLPLILYFLLHGWPFY